jgi:hypothetical protein
MSSTTVRVFCAEPRGEAIAYCRPPDDVPFEQVAAAIHAAGPDSALPASVPRFDLHNPYVRVRDGGERASPRFTLEPIVRLIYEGREPEMATRELELSRELAAMDCARLATCPGALRSLALWMFRPFDEHPLVLPPLLGALLGMIFGGYARRRSLAYGSASVGLLLAAAAVGLVWLISTADGNDAGFVLMGAMVLISAAGGALAWALPAFFVALLLVRALHEKPA